MAPVFECVSGPHAGFSLCFLLIYASLPGVVFSHSAVYLHHADLKLCSDQTNTVSFRANIIQCANLATVAGAPAFNFCPEEDLNCGISRTSYSLGQWNASQTSRCRLFSTLLPLPVVPTFNKTKQFVLASGISPSGQADDLVAGEFCLNEGFEFAVISSIAEAQLALDQVGPEIKARCDVYCRAWVLVNATAHWHDGSHLNLCELRAKGTPNSTHCLTMNWDATHLSSVPCKKVSMPVVCQTYQ